MAERQFYKNAPIVEAVIALGWTYDDFPVEKLTELRGVIGEEYPAMSALNHADIAIDEKSSDTRVTLVGYRFDHVDKKYVLQTRCDGFTLSVLAPYDSWEPFRDEARKIWDVYRSKMTPKQVSRVAVRYINQVNIPYTDETNRLEQSDYFRTYPEVSKDYPHSNIEHFLMKLIIPQPDIHGVLGLTQARTAPPDDQTVSILLDIDLFSERLSNPWDATHDDAMWQFLEVLHVRKNEIFEASITRRTKELIQ